MSCINASEYQFLLLTVPSNYCYFVLEHIHLVCDADLCSERSAVCTMKSDSHIQCVQLSATRVTAYKYVA